MVNPGLVRSIRHTKAQVLPEFVESTSAAGFTAFLFDALDPSKFNARPPYRFLARNTGADQIIRAGSHVRLQLGVHLPLHAKTMESGLQPESETGSKWSYFLHVDAQSSREQLQAQSFLSATRGIDVHGAARQGRSKPRV